MKKIISLLLISAFIISSFAFMSVANATTFYIGNDANYRSITDTYHNFTIIDTNKPASDYGMITNFNYYAANTNAFRFVLVNGSNVVQWVSDEITPSIAAGSNAWSPGSPVYVEPGWNLGLYFALTGTVPFEYVGEPAYYESNNAGLPVIGEALSYAGSSNRVYSFIATVLPFERYAEITSPGEDTIVYGETEFAAFLIDNEKDFVDWAVRKGTCAAGTNTVLGNVDGHHNEFDMIYNSAEYKYSYSITADISSWDSGMYCFIFNPREDSGESGIRLTREFYVAEGYVNGGGQIREDADEDDLDNGKKDYKISFGGQVWDVGSEGYMGDWQINFHNVEGINYDKARFHATEVQIINFYTGTSLSCDEAMNMTLIGTLNGEEGYEVIFRAGDLMEGRYSSEYPDGIDTVRIELYEGNTKVYDTNDGDFTAESSCVGTARTGLDAGNIKIEFTP